MKNLHTRNSRVAAVSVVLCANIFLMARADASPTTTGEVAREGAALVATSDSAIDSASDVASEAAIAADDAADSLPDAAERRNFRKFWDSELERISELDIYGITGQLPKGYLKVKYDLGWLRAKQRYNSASELTPVIAPIEFGGDESKLLSVDLDLRGRGLGHTFQASYGITDPLDWYIEIPFTEMHLKMHPEVNTIDEAGNRIAPSIGGLLGVTDPTTYDVGNFLYETLPALGRPTPATEFDGKWLMGDINTGFSWNYYRNKYFSGAFTGRIFLPTSHIPDANSSLTYATGPQIEVGVGSWALSCTQGYDVRLFKHSNWLSGILSSELGVGYAFTQKRDYPTNFVTPSAAAAAVDPVAFADLSGLDGKFKYTPGWNMDWSAKFSLQLALLTLGAGYGVAHSEAPKISGDEAFVAMVDSCNCSARKRRIKRRLAPR